MRGIASRIGPSLRRRLGEVRTSSLRRDIINQVRELDRMNVSIVSNNCVAGILCEWAGIPKQTPTAGVYFVGPAYARFLADISLRQLDHWTNVRQSSLIYKEAQRCWALPGPAGGELVFLHYPDPAVALEKWTRRLGRLRGRTPLILSSIRDSIDPTSLAHVLDKFQMTFVVTGNPAPAADELVLDGQFLRPFSEYLDEVIAGGAHGRAVRAITI